MPSKIVGMYVHQHWAYNHPYAARTWSLEDWRGYADGLHRLGYNTIMIWPVLETMPNPLTESDRANLDRIARVTDLLHREFGMRVHIALCPNVAAKDAEAAKYAFEQRPFFHTDRRVNPGDPEAMRQLIAWRAQLFEPLKHVDAVTIIDSDPGGYPGSNDREFVHLLGEHRKMLDTLRPGIELIYWIHTGWQAYCDYYRTGEFRNGTQEEIDGALALLSALNPEPWAITGYRGPHVADKVGQAARVINAQYGAIEGEPSFPMTNFGGDTAYNAGKTMGARGTMGNAQSHCLQLPNTFAFAQGALGKPLPTEADYVRFAGDLLVGQGALIVKAWTALAGPDPEGMLAAAEALEKLPADKLEPGPLKGLLFNDPARFVRDLVQQLRVKATLRQFHAAAMQEPRDAQRVKETFAQFVPAIETWQKQHGYSNNWDWPELDEALHKLDAPPVNEVLATKGYRGEGATPFEQVQKGFLMTETYVPRLIAAMKKTIGEE